MVFFNIILSHQMNVEIQGSGEHQFDSNQVSEEEVPILNIVTQDVRIVI